MQKGRLRQVRPAGPTLRFGFNPTTVTPSGGVGGWEEVARPRRTAVVSWQGRPAKRIAFTLTFDGWPDQSVEDDCRILHNMGEPRAPGKPPPELRLMYGPYGTGDQTWVIEDLEWGEELRDSELRRVRQEVTVTLLEYRSPDFALSPADRHKRKHKADKDGKRHKGRHAAYVIKRGDSLASIAVQTLGRASAWRDIAEANGIRDPEHLRTGQRLRIPGG